MAGRSSSDPAEVLLGDAQELLQHIPRGSERNSLSRTLKPEVAEQIVEALVLLRERVNLFARRRELRWHPLLGWIHKDSRCFEDAELEPEKPA